MNKPSTFPGDAMTPNPPPTAPAAVGESALVLARAVIAEEAQAVAALAARIDATFLQALRLLLACRGRVVVSGIGKSGHIGRKIASTLASTGTPALFVHAAEAAHGDLGMITPADVFLGLSNSGTSPELMTIVPILKREGTPLIAITGSATSPLAQAADVHLDCRVDLWGPSILGNFLVIDVTPVSPVNCDFCITVSMSVLHHPMNVGSETV